MNYENFTEKTSSEKVVICHIEPSQRLILFTLVSGSIYKKTVSHFVVDCYEGLTQLIEANSSSLNTGEWYYDAATSELYVRTSDDSNPSTKEIISTYRLFYSGKPLNIPYDLSTGVSVNYEGRLESNSPINKDLDDEQIGIVLESNTSIKLENSDAHFDEFYDTLFFENKRVNLWSWSPLLPLSEARKIFTGEIQDKAYSDRDVTFKCKDFIYKLRANLDLELFSNSDGSVPERYLNTPKRRLYGQFKQLRCVPIDSILEGFTLTGTISVNTASATITGVGTSFLDECSPEDELIYETDLQTYKFSIESVDSDTQITLSDESTVTFSNEIIKNKPKRPWRKKSRSWHISGHKLRSPSTTVTNSDQANRITVDNVSDVFAGDLVKVSGESAFVRRVSGNLIVLTANLQAGIPSVGATVVKVPVSKAFINGSEVFIDRDWSVTNTTEGILNLDNDAEFNVAPKRNFPVNLTFTNGSRTVTGTGIDFKVELESRDWIRGTNVSFPEWYEVLSVEENEIKLRTNYIGPTATIAAEKKNVDLLDDDSIITVNTLGLEDSSIWIKTASQAVKHLIQNDAGLTNISTDDFTEAESDAPYTLSYVIPESIGGKNESIKKVISEINSSVFGSITYDTNFDIRYQILHAERPDTLETIEDHDLVGSVSYRSDNDVKRKINAQYSPFTDKFSGDSTFELYEFENDFVDKYIGSKDEMDVILYLFNQDDAVTIAQRYGLYHSLSKSVITIRSKLALSLKNLNDKVLIKLDRLYKRFANKDRRKIGIINKIRFDGYNTMVEINDLGNNFNRVGVVSTAGSSDFTSADDSEKITSAYIVDTDIEVPDPTSDDEIFSNLIG